MAQLSCAIKLLQQLRNCVSNKLPKQTWIPVIQSSDDDDIVSSLMLVAYRRRQLRVRSTRNRTIWARHWISKSEEYGAYNGLVREIRVNDTASYWVWVKGQFRLSARFEYALIQRWRRSSTLVST